MSTIYIDPTASPGGNGTLARPYSGWEGVKIEAGNTYLQKGGTTYEGTIHVANAVDPANPISLGSYGTGNAIVKGEVLLVSPNGVKVSGFDISGSQEGGITISGDASNVLIENNTIHNNAVGVQLVEGTVDGVVIRNNTLAQNDTQGVYAYNSTAVGSGASVDGNTIVQNGMQGVLLYANGYVIENNQIHNNGLSGLPGTSGIHMIAASEEQVAGDYNIVRYNTISGQHDAEAYDGNGIQADHYADHNEIYGNVIFGNDGPGISILDAYGTVVSDNVLYGNNVDPGGTHRDLGSIVVTGSLRMRGGSEGTIVVNNQIVATNPDGVALLIDLQSLQNGASFTGNIVANLSGGDLFSARGDTLTYVQWNNLMGGVDQLLAISAALALEPDAINPNWTSTEFTITSTIFDQSNANAPNFRLGSDSTDRLEGSFFADVLAGRGGDDQVVGAGGADVLVGNDGDDLVDGGDGDDQVWGGAGKDLMLGAIGNDLLDAGSDNDLVYGGVGDDVIFGANGDDVTFGEQGNDTIKGDDGDDQLYAGTGRDLVEGGAGNDTLSATDDANGDFLRGGSGKDVITGGIGLDLIFGGEGNDVIAGLGGSDAIYGDSGNDKIDLSNAGSGSGQSYGGSGDDVIIGSGFADYVYGDNGFDRLFGGYGSDQIDGGSDDDAIYGGAEGDVLIGNDGNDVIYGDLGNDTLNGGEGNDTLNGGDGNDLIDGGAGNDSLNGNEGDNILIGGTGNDRLRASKGNDTQFGHSGNDMLVGSGGNDLLEGGADDDRLMGGSGSDVFLYHEGDGTDTIRDFDVSDHIAFELNADGTGYRSFSDFAAQITGGENAFIPTPDGGILLIGVAAASLNAEDFYFF